jgi:hypothetical protein
MRFIFGTSLVAVVFALAPANARAQLPALNYGSSVGAITDITGNVDNPGVGWQLENGAFFDPCPPTQHYGANLGWGWIGDQPRSTGGDGVPLTADSGPLDADGRLEITSAAADSTRGEARTAASADVSLPCWVFGDGTPIMMAAAGRAFAQFYKTYDVVSAPDASTFDLSWSLHGSFSSIPADYYAGGGAADLFIYLLASPLSEPAGGTPSNAAYLVGHLIFSNPALGNAGACWDGSCGAAPKDAVINLGGTIDVGPAFEWATNRPLAAGESFIIGTFLVTETRACGFPDGCNITPVFTTDFSVSANIVASGGGVVSPR